MSDIDSVDRRQKNEKLAICKTSEAAHIGERRENKKSFNRCHVISPFIFYNFLSFFKFNHNFHAKEKTNKSGPQGKRGKK